MTKAERAELERRFWDRYVKLLNGQGVNPPFDRWYVKRAEEFIRAFPHRRLAKIGAEEVSAYLARLGRSERLKPWQFKQVVGAIQILYNIVITEWAERFDWNFWLDSVRTLGPQHATNARELPPVTPEEFSERLGDTRFTPLIRCHLDMFTTLANVCRTRGMAYRTEQSYGAWACRYMLFFDGRNPAEMGEREVGSFLGNDMGTE